VIPTIEQSSQISVITPDDIICALQSLLSPYSGSDTVGLLLSGGIDSAILGALLPVGCRAYTIRFIADGAVDESVQAAEYADQFSLRHTVVDVTWDDYAETMNDLMYNKMSPLHPVEVGLYRAAQQASRDGVRTLIVGNGADSTFGGLDKLLAKDWTVDQFTHRYTFVNPSEVVSRPISMGEWFRMYELAGGTIDTSAFVKTVHGQGVMQAFANAITLAGCDILEPYESLAMGIPLDITRIRGGESKYLLRSVFDQLYRGIEIPDKIAFARPMNCWLSDWQGPSRAEFLSDLDMTQFTGEQKWVLFCLERFMDLYDVAVP
jgi:hypothetical protein